MGLMNEAQGFSAEFRYADVVRMKMKDEAEGSFSPDGVSSWKH
jgi:hypothetical protein